MDFIETLSEEMRQYILMFLDMKNLMTLLLVNKTVRRSALAVVRMTRRNKLQTMNFDTIVWKLAMNTSMSKYFETKVMELIKIISLEVPPHIFDNLVKGVEPFRYNAFHNPLFLPID